MYIAHIKYEFHYTSVMFSISLMNNCIVKIRNILMAFRLHQDVMSIRKSILPSNGDWLFKHWSQST